jgi:hypothetical protein
MPCYAGLDVSQRDTQLCVVDAQGAVLWTGKVPTDPRLGVRSCNRARRARSVRAVAPLARACPARHQAAFIVRRGKATVSSVLTSSRVEA